MNYRNFNGAVRLSPHSTFGKGQGGASAVSAWTKCICSSSCCTFLPSVQYPLSICPTKLTSGGVLEEVPSPKGERDPLLTLQKPHQNVVLVWNHCMMGEPPFDPVSHEQPASPQANCKTLDGYPHPWWWGVWSSSCPNISTEAQGHIANNLVIYLNPILLTLELVPFHDHTPSYSLSGSHFPHLIINRYWRPSELKWNKMLAAEGFEKLNPPRKRSQHYCSLMNKTGKTLEFSGSRLARGSALWGNPANTRWPSQSLFIAALFKRSK